MDTGNKPKRSFMSGLGGFLGDDQAGEDIKADNFKTEKNIIAAYKTATAEEIERRRAAALAMNDPGRPSPAPARPAQPKPGLFRSRKIEYTAPAAPTTAPAPAKAAVLEASADRSGKYFYSSNRWQAPEILKTNLISGDVGTFVSWGKYFSITALSLLACAAVLAMVYLGLLYWEKQTSAEGAELVAEIQALDQEIDRIKEGVKETDLFQRRLAVSGELMDGHIYWTKFFQILEGLFLSEAKLSGTFKSSLDGKYSFNVEAESFESIYDQLLAMRNNPAVLEVKVNSGTLEAAKEKAGGGEPPRVKFTLDIIIDPELIKHKIE